MGRVRQYLSRTRRTVKWRAKRDVGDRFFANSVAAKLSPKTQVWYLGDSHMRVFNRVQIPGVWPRVVVVRGATASGIRNPQSQTEALRTFREVMRRVRPWQHVVVGLGEVDCGFLIWHRAQARGRTVEDLLSEALDRYVEFLVEVRDLPARSVTVVSAPLPTIVDYAAAFKNRDAHMRSSIDADIDDRIELTLEFNRRLTERCAEIGVRFVDFSDQQLDVDTGRIREELVDRTSHDHHLNEGPYAAMIEQEFRALEFPRAIG
jgi:hypothetical protein